MNARDVVDRLATVPAAGLAGPALLATYVYRLLLSRDLDTYATYFDLATGSAQSLTITDGEGISREILVERRRLDDDPG
jgi:hypothetical protein